MKRLVMMFSSLSISSPFLHAPSSLGRKKRASLKPFLPVARYGSDTTTNNEDDDEKFLSLLERITLSLRIESRHQFSNVEGKQMPFSAFARAYFPKIVVNVEKEKESAVLDGFAKYETLTREERETVVKEAGILVERLVSREKTKTKEKSRANDAAKAVATVESAAPSVVSSSSVHARAGSSFSDIAQSSPLARPSPSSSGTSTSTSRQILPKERAIGKSFIVDTPQWEHALKEDARRRKELEKVVEQKKDEGAKKERDDEKSTNVNATASTPPVKVQDFGSEEEDESQKQGTDEWKALRATRLTASAFSNAVGFWRDGRNALWEEKLGIGIPFTGNEATEWGTKTEDEACEAYAALTNASVSHLLFRALSPDEAELWMGASPDGLVVAATTDAAEYKSEVANNGDASDSLNNNERGILEVKCPFNRGKPLEAKPYPKVPWYYVPQVQGLMAVFDRPWVDVFAYTVNNGCAIYRVKRDREYWAQMYEALSEFWWQHVVPAKHAMHRGLDFEKYRPSEEHHKCQTLKVKSQRIANESTTWVISKKDLDEIIARHRATKKAAENNNTNASEEEFVVFDSTTTTTTRAKSSSNDDQRVSDSTKKVLNETALEPSWRALLADEFHQPYLEFGLNEFLDDEFQNNKKVFPPKDLIFNAFEKTPVDKVKVVIVGQDPYHNDDQAMGLAFSVPRETTKIPPSLKNIFKELEEDTREARERGDEEVEFTIPAHGDLTKWAEQGVLLLNTSLTVRAHEANSHSGKGWETFTDRAIEQLSQNTENVVFLLWGKNATSKERLIAEGHNHFILKCAHPSPLSASRGFFGCRHFSQTNEFLREVGRETIDWRL